MTLNETKTRNRVTNVTNNKTSGFNWQLLAICSICCCAVMLTGLIGMVVQSGADTRLNDVATTPNVTNSHNNYYGMLPDAIKQQLQPTTTPPVVIQPQTQPQHIDDCRIFDDWGPSLKSIEELTSDRKLVDGTWVFDKSKGKRRLDHTAELKMKMTTHSG